jgi:UDP-N-acetylmuramate dehydrogenase
VSAETVERVLHAVEWAHAHDRPVTVLSGGSNVVVSDRGVAGLVLQIALRGVTTRSEREDVVVSAAAGEPWDELVAWAVSQELSGIECLSGIPGTVGATPIQNVGAYGQEVAQVVEAVSVLDVRTGGVQTIAGSDCGFGYRRSRFKIEDAGRFIVTGVTFRLRRGGGATVRYPELARALSERGAPLPCLQDVRATVLALRRAKGMVLDEHDGDTRSVGSFFTNPVVTSAEVEAIARRGVVPPSYPSEGGLFKVPAAWLLEHSGCGRGFGAGRVGLSNKHPLAVVNRGGATAAEVVAFAARVKQQVDDTFGVRLVPEPVFLGFGDDETVRYLTSAA